MINPQINETNFNIYKYLNISYLKSLFRTNCDLSHS